MSKICQLMRNRICHLRGLIKDNMACLMTPDAVIQWRNSSPLRVWLFLIQGIRQNYLSPPSPHHCLHPLTLPPLLFLVCREKTSDLWRLALFKGYHGEDTHMHAHTQRRGQQRWKLTWMLQSESILGYLFFFFFSLFSIVTIFCNKAFEGSRFTC